MQAGEVWRPRRDSNPNGTPTFTGSSSPELASHAVQDQPPRAALPDLSGFQISLVTVMAYAMAFGFEAGHAGAFGVPLQMVDLQLVPALFGMLMALVTLWWVLHVIDPILPLLQPRATDHPVVTVLKPFVAILGIVLIVWLYGGIRLGRGFWLLLGLLFLAYPGLDLLLPLLRRDAKGYLEKMQRYQETRVELRQPIRDYLVANARVTVSVFALLIAIALSALAGMARGNRQQDFYVTNLKPETIVLRIYGNRALAAEFIRAEKRITPTYRFLRLDDPGLSLTLERVGPITFTTGTPRQ